jgi:hypothetical protein
MFIGGAFGSAGVTGLPELDTRFPPLNEQLESQDPTQELGTDQL